MRIKLIPSSVKNISDIAAVDVSIHLMGFDAMRDKSDIVAVRLFIKEGIVPDRKQHASCLSRSCTYILFQDSNRSKQNMNKTCPNEQRK